MGTDSLRAVKTGSFQWINEGTVTFFLIGGDILTSLRLKQVPASGISPAWTLNVVSYSVSQHNNVWENYLADQAPPSIA